MFKLGKVTLSPPILLAPMAGVSDLPFRLITRSFGCEFAFAEMVSARALAYKSKKTLKLIASVPEDKPLGVQLLGADPVFIRQAIEIINQSDFAALDFNAACPVRKAVNRGEGAALLKDPKKLHALLQIIVKESRLAASVKIRSGWDENSVNAVDIARLAEDAGVKTIFIHGRTRAQSYRGKVDYNIIRKVKESVQIPVVGSGDAFSPELVKKMFDETGCDAVAIARGALGNPWIFPQVAQFFKDGATAPQHSLDDLIKTMHKHFELLCDFHGERIGVVVFRKFFYWYTKRIPGIRPLREKTFRAKTKEEVTNIMDELTRMDLIAPG
ncbi:MAG: tRNA dihydrouridine synthase DusB [Planctomycetes bacterium]|nr:tRNA dihydrouridine synthase DusB [Planctomycetota bacterium]